nr:uncharacterized protein LOC126526294 [Dermacentor andersoni]
MSVGELSVVAKAACHAVQCSLPEAAKSVGCSFKAQSESRSAQTTETVDLLSSSSVFKALPGHRPIVKRLTERHFPSYIPRTEKKTTSDSPLFRVQPGKGQQREEDTQGNEDLV